MLCRQDSSVSVRSAQRGHAWKRYNTLEKSLVLVAGGSVHLSLTLPFVDFFDVSLDGTLVSRDFLILEGVLPVGFSMKIRIQVTVTIIRESSAAYSLMSSS